jgi:hypothetical protein
MKITNAGKLDRKSGVRRGERGAPVRFPSNAAMTQTPAGLVLLRTYPHSSVLGQVQQSLRDCFR